jgi:hypothetical protein
MTRSFLRPRTVRALAFATGLGAAGCGQPNPRVIESTEVARQPREADGAELSEPRKIRALIEAVRESDATFVHGGEDRKGPEAAEALERRMARQQGGIPTVRQFIDGVATGTSHSKNPDVVRLPDGTVMAASDWFEARLAELEGLPVPEGVPAAGEAGALAVEVPVAEASAELGILDALTIVEQSDLRFVAPARKTPTGKMKGKRKEYSGPDFSEMLRRKWELLGADIHDLDTFVDEIATDAFTSFQSYRVLYADGHEEEFRQWLLDRLEAKRQKVARGGSP